MSWRAESLSVIVEGAVRFSRLGRSLGSSRSTLRGDPAVPHRPLALGRAGPRTRGGIPALHMDIFRRAPRNATNPENLFLPGGHLATRAYSKGSLASSAFSRSMA